MRVRGLIPFVLAFVLASISASAQFFNPAMYFPTASTGIAVTIIGANHNDSGATLAVTSVTVPSGAFIGVLVDEWSGANGGMSMSDGGTNTYAQVTGFPIVDTTNDILGSFFFVANATSISAATLTYTKHNTANNASMIAFYATGIATTTPVDTTVTPTTGAGSSTSPTVTSNAAAQSGELFIGIVFAKNNQASFTQDGTHGWTNPATNDQQATNGFLGWAYQVNAGTSAKTYAPTLGTTSPWDVTIIGLKHP